VGNLSNQANYFWNSAFTSTYTSTFSSATSPLILEAKHITSAGNIYWNLYNYENYSSAIYSATGTFAAGSAYTLAYASTLDLSRIGESSEYIFCSCLCLLSILPAQRHYVKRKLRRRKQLRSLAD